MNHLSLAALLLALGLPSSLMLACSPRPAASAPRIYETRGTIKSFGPNRAYATIHHDTIPGYMEAMTMSFEAREEGQLAPFEVGQRVSFSFSDEEGRRVILTIRKE
ncbi:MAG: copper-binding protein [Myxococcales bacterium]|nr:copper-binding protein [Polyangiaceae bacterium]MDW8249756.1 copper-binding protein [Myxococcales bacterium]